MLLVRHPATWLAERRYITGVMLGEYLGQAFRMECHTGNDWEISRDGDEAGARLILADVLFQVPESEWLTAAALPDQPLPVMQPEAVTWADLPVAQPVPVIYGAVLPDGGYFQRAGTVFSCGLDMFGSAFFMLTRYEEVVKPERDRHDRFPARASLAVQEGFLHLPVVNIYLELLWAALHSLFPDLTRPKRTPRTLLSHDVDWPAVTWGRSGRQVLRAMSADAFKRRDPVLALRRGGSMWSTRRGHPERDVGNVFDSIMTLSERYRLRSTFFFIASDGDGGIDGAYTVEDPWIRSLMRQMHERGHEIGIHPGYGTYLDPELTKRQFDRLRHACLDEGIEQVRWGGRQHYLRWQNPVTWSAYEAAGIDYDTTLAFADRIGFRCGVCYAFPVFDLHARRQLVLLEQPLVAMDATMFGDSAKDGMALDAETAIAMLASLKATCSAYNGDFTLLWHNTWLIESRLAKTYERVLMCVADEADDRY